MTDRNKTGLVLEGGGMRGAFTTGVLDFFLDSLDKEFSFHSCMGVSAGAIHACSFLSKQKGRGFETNIDYLEDEQYGSFKNLIKTQPVIRLTTKATKFIFNTLLTKPSDLMQYKKVCPRK